MNIKLFVVLFIVITLISGCGDDEVALTEDEQFAADIELIDNHLSSNNISAEAHESGIRYVRNTVGTGNSPETGSSLIVKYIGTLLDGTVFDFNITGGNVILDSNLPVESWEIMLPEIREGGKMTIYAPSKYGFGPSGKGPIPPNAVLVYEIEFISFLRSVEDQREVDLAKIDDYLDRNGIDALIHSSGIRYEIVKEGTGLNPILSDRVTVDYVGRFLNDEVFDQKSEDSRQLNVYIPAWKTMIPEMQEGGKIIIYAPSDLCYGVVGSGTSINPNENLIFEIELISIN